jgi:hypothetical protein
VIFLFILSALVISLKFLFICFLSFYLSFKVTFCITNPDYCLIQLTSSSPSPNYPGLARVYCTYIYTTCTEMHSLSTLKVSRGRIWNSERLTEMQHFTHLYVAGDRRHRRSLRVR